MNNINEQTEKMTQDEFYFFESGEVTSLTMQSESSKYKITGKA
ncbi:hypothetical protein [Peribacillus butanolivorans]